MCCNTALLDYNNVFHDNINSKCQETGLMSPDALLLIKSMAIVDETDISKNQSNGLVGIVIWSQIEI